MPQPEPQAEKPQEVIVSAATRSADLFATRHLSEVYTPEPRLPVSTDEEAERILPRFVLVMEQYHQLRLEGEAPEPALQKTLAVWRELWAGGAYVPHQFRL